MTPAARLQAAIEVLADIFARRRPAADALKDWGLGHRFAGSKDRAAIASLTYDALRKKASAAWLMGAETPRAVLLGSLRLLPAMSEEEIARLCSGDRFAPESISEDERTRLQLDPAAVLSNAPAHIAGDFPDWLEPSLSRRFGDALPREMHALATRAPVDVRANSLKSLRDPLRQKLSHLGAADTPYSPVGLRFSAGEGGRGPALQATEEFQKGLFEIQDEGSQLVALLAGAEPGDQVIDLCAGGGGKTLSLAAAMNNSGQIYATDNDARRLAPIHQRLERAGARNVQVRTPKGRDDEPLRGLEGKADLVLIDAPCTGVGVWRRNPDAKWRVRPGALEQRMAEQDFVLGRAARLVKPGGRIAYITCSTLIEENEDRVSAFLNDHPEFSPVDAREQMALAPDALCERTDIIAGDGLGLLLTPARTGTDGFFLALLRRSG
ncbi:RsmB/NOP family class I SAM-dependent RNA methyltransferase [Terrarubrum flagellatum]|uniref:RsmB/NOP family class I SAM-dependent RNA methyltransferase n=1 Tax=Terrirubrum flagellatum TaxID=2895980 RepID=UPI003144E6F7